MSKLRKLVTDSSSNVIVNLLGNIISIVTLPFYLSLYGDTLWGIYIWATSVSGLLSSFDFGVKAGLRRFVALYNKTGNKQEVEISLSLSTFIVGIVGIINFILIIIFSFIPDVAMKLGEEFVETGRYILIIAAFYSLTFWGTKILESILEGYQLYLIKNQNRLITLSLQIVVYVIALYNELDFILLAGLLFATRSLVFFLHLGHIYFSKLLRGLKIRLKLRREDFKSGFFKFSTDVFILALLQLLVFKVDVFIIGATLGGALITKYVVVTKPMFIVKMIDSNMFSAVQPMIAGEHANNNINFLKKMIKKGALVNFMILSPLCILVALLLKPFLNIWIGNDFDEYVIWGQVAILMYMLRPFYGVITKVLLNAGITKPMLKIRVIFSLTTFFFSVLLVFYFGIGGVVLGSLIGFTINIPLYYQVVRREFQISLHSIITPAVILLHLYIIAIGFLLNYGLSYVEITSWLHLIISGIVGGLIIYAYSFYQLLVVEKLFYKIVKQGKS